MSDTLPRKALVLAVGVGVLVAAISGGAATYALFNDSGSVDVTFTAGNITTGSDETLQGKSFESNNESTQNDTTQNDTTQNDTTQNDTTQNDTTQNDTTQKDTTQNDTTQNDSTTNDSTTNELKQLSDGLSKTSVPTTNGLNVDPTSTQFSAAAVTLVDHRRPPGNDRR